VIRDFVDYLCIHDNSIERNQIGYEQADLLFFVKGNRRQVPAEKEFFRAQTPRLAHFHRVSQPDRDQAYSELRLHTQRSERLHSCTTASLHLCAVVSISG
jgi:hypothetical protein